MAKYIIKDGKRVPREVERTEKSSGSGKTKKPTPKGKSDQAEGGKQ